MKQMWKRPGVKTQPVKGGKDSDRRRIKKFEIFKKNKKKLKKKKFYNFYTSI